MNNFIINPRWRAVSKLSEVDKLRVVYDIDGFKGPLTGGWRMCMKCSSVIYYTKKSRDVCPLCRREKIFQPTKDPIKICGGVVGHTPMSTPIEDLSAVMTEEEKEMYEKERDKFFEEKKMLKKDEIKPTDVVVEEEVIAEYLSKLPIELADELQDLLDKGFTSNQAIMDAFESIEELNPFEAFAVIQKLPQSLRREPKLKYELVAGDKKINIKFNDDEIKELDKLVQQLKCSKTAIIRNCIIVCLENKELILDNFDLLGK